MKRHLVTVLSALAIAGVAPRAEAASVTFQLTCILANGPACTPSGSFGTVTLDDAHASLVGGAGDLYINIDLNGGGKFRDLMLNFGGGAARITSADGEATLVADGFSLPPYSGVFFDVGSNTSQGWSSTSDPYSTILYGWTATGSTAAAGTGGSSNVALTLADFLFPDLNGVYGAMHIQTLNCQIAPCPQGYTADSIKVGLRLRTDNDLIIQQVPEPTLLAMLGGGLAFSARRLRRRR